MKRPRPQQVQRALEVLAQHFGTELGHGRDFTGRVRMECLDVEIDVRPRNVVDRRAVEQFRREAVDHFARWGGGCAEYVRDRHAWSPGSTRRCRQPVVAAIVRHGRFDKNVRCYSYCCKTHLDAESAGSTVIGVLRLSPSEVRAARMERERRAELRARGVIVPGDRPEVDTAIECAVLTLAAVVRANADRSAA